MLVKDNKIRNYEMSLEKTHGKRSWRVRSTMAIRYLGREYISEAKTKLGTKQLLKNLTEEKKEALKSIFYGKYNEPLISIWV